MALTENDIAHIVQRIVPAVVDAVIAELRTQFPMLEVPPAVLAQRPTPVAANRNTDTIPSP